MHIANAPCSWGILEFEETTERFSGYSKVLDEIAATGYAGTELLKLHGEPATWLTIDRWRDEADYARAKASLADDYAALDRRCEAYTYDETWLGLHTVVD